MSGEDRAAIFQEVAQPVHARAGLGTRQHSLIAELSVKSEDRLDAGRLDEVGFVDADQSSGLALFRADNEPVDEAWLERRFCGRRHDHNLIDVRHDDMLVPPAVARERTLPRLDTLDDSEAVVEFLKQYPVASHDRVAGFSRQRSHDAPNRALVLIAFFVLHDRVQPGGHKHAAARAGGLVNLDPQFTVLTSFRDDGAVAGQVALAGEPLARRQVRNLRRPLAILARHFDVTSEITLPRPLLAVLAEGDPLLLLLLFCH